MNPLEQLDTVDLTKLTFVQYVIVPNCKNSNTRIFVYKYLHFIMFRFFACMCIKLSVDYAKCFIINACLE
jgi:hypothetical protein